VRSDIVVASPTYFMYVCSAMSSIVSETAPLSFWMFGSAAFPSIPQVTVPLLDPGFRLLRRNWNWRAYVMVR
jgi:hypothetical protein